MEEDVIAAREMLEITLKQRKDRPVHLEQANIQPKVGTCTYYVSFSGFYVSPKVHVVGRYIEGGSFSFLGRT